MAADPLIAAADPTGLAPPGPFKELWRDFRRNRGAVIGLAIVVTMIVTALLADFIAPYSPSEQFRDAFLQPPSTQPVGGHVFLLGTDPVGRDLLSRLIHGTRLLLFDRALARHPREGGGPARQKKRLGSRFRGNDEKA